MQSHDESIKHANKINLETVGSATSLLLNIQRLNIPNAIRVLVSDTIHREEAHACHRANRLGKPLLFVKECLVDHLMCGDVGVEIVRDQVVVAGLLDGIGEGGEVARVAECVALDCGEDALQLGVKLEIAVEVSVTEILDIFSEVAEEEDVLFADFAGDFDLD